MSVAAEALAFASTQTWAMDRGALEAHLQSLSMASGALAGRLDEDRPTRNVAGGVGTLDVVGSIMPRANIWMRIFGGTAVDDLRATLRQHLRDPDVASILMRIDSPGGVVDGVPEFADELREAARQKPIVAQVQGMCASAAYWLATSAFRISAFVSSDVGSVGVYYPHVDRSKRYEQEGIRREFIQFGEFKTEGRDDQPLTKAGRDHLQKGIDDMGRMFVAAVARGRRTQPATVLATFGQGRVYLAEEALRRGMIDHVARTVGEADSYQRASVADARRWQLDCDLVATTLARFNL